MKVIELDEKKICVEDEELDSKLRELREKTTLPLSELRKKVREAKYYREQVVIEFIAKVQKKNRKGYPVFMESRVWHYRSECDEPMDKHEMLDEAWWNMVAIPSIIDAFRKDTIYERVVGIYGEEDEEVDKDEVEEICRLYRMVINHNTDWERASPELDEDLKILEEAMKRETIRDLTGRPVTKGDIVRWMKQGRWELVFRIMYRFWVENGFWWGSP